MATRINNNRLPNHRHHSECHGVIAGMRRSSGLIVTAGLSMMIIMLALLSVTGPSYAQHAVEMIDIDGGSGTSIDGFQGILDGFPAIGETGITMRLIISVKETLEAVFIVFMTGGINNLMMAVTNALILLAIAIFGVKVSLGLTRVAKVEGMVLLFKIGGVAYFMGTLAAWYPELFNSMDDLIGIVSADLQNIVGGGAFGFSCEMPDGSLPDSIAAVVPDGNADQYRIWFLLDCLLVNILGFVGVGMGASVVLGVILSSVFSGYIGVYVTVLGIGAFGAMIFSILRVAYTYVTSLIIITFLLALAPMFIPLILFQGTMKYFDQWIKLVIAFALYPIMAIAFISMMTIVYYEVLFKGEYSLGFALSGYEEYADYSAAFADNVVNIGDFNTDHLLAAFDEKILSKTCFEEAQFWQDNDPTETGDWPDWQKWFFNQGTGPGTHSRGNEEIGTCTEVGLDQVFDYRYLTETYDRGGGDAETMEAELEVVKAMRKLLFSFVIILIISYLAYTLTQNLEAISKFLVGMSFRLQVNFSVPLERNFNNFLTGGVNPTTGRQEGGVLQRGMEASSLLPGMLEMQDGEMPGQPVLSALGASAGTHLIPGLNDVLYALDRQNTDSGPGVTQGGPAPFNELTNEEDEADLQALNEEIDNAAQDAMFEQGN